MRACVNSKLRIHNNKCVCMGGRAGFMAGGNIKDVKREGN